ncbi:MULTISPECIES: histidine phosphatase family protein [Rhizobium]|uniref:Histidine phosphatase family protein n=1 Tax=Rhizobium rhododendri TaxID=2506430 RepID=A0ABY8ILD5_9HYPH|nr:MULTISPECIES: histidine phosphatase family protein [Rhizobium]MBZ5759928.1 histidine phosphatase family protein [Rhizobium sp. VS19-DR96]MBZ5766591.1 histidine phosphatase family protein [Rhizobium sp. VS19-DR129.2]MBZ5776848.1 histidine phosphatase family protein [Rhizobium sp. VS19-DRK62.2]MBZ5787980.1 histidine phosphatase family protein [Rhizobium sp. VS19-DR121]MBZ5805448.1 histidine phosphatase family protein [Rhizobium sp. VS19-DR181]
MIYLVRHGQTEFNAAGRWQGQVDSGLTTLGRQQAERVGATLRGLIDPDSTAIFSSPLGRAADTAAIIAGAAGFGDEIVFDPRLMEIGMGCWDGLTTYEIEMEWPGALDGLSRFEWFFHSPDGEGFAGFAERLLEALAEVKRHPAANKIIVSHGVAGRVIRGIYADLEQADALGLDVPQDAIFALDGGIVTRIDCQ